MKNFYLLPLLIIAALPACAKFSRLSNQAGFTEVTLNKRSGASILATLNGGLMVYAIRDDGYSASFKLNNELDEKSVMLPNGNYTFRAVGYPSPQLQGTPRCGVAGRGSAVAGDTYSLTGTSTVVPITVSAGGCLTDAFADAVNRSGSLRKANFVFCGDNSSFGVQSSSSDCTAGKESAKFFKGKTATEGVKYGIYKEGPNRLIYMADAHRSSIFDLISVTTNGEKPIRMNNDLGPGETVSQALSIPRTDKIIYLAGITLPAAPTTKMFLADPARPGGRDMLPAGFGHSVRQIKITYDGSHVVFVAYRQSDGKDYLYAASLANLDQPLSPFLLSPSAVAAPGALGMKAADGGYRVSFGYKLFPTDLSLAPGQTSKVLFVGSFSTAKDELYTASVSNPPGRLNLNPGTGVLASGIAQSGFNGNGTKVLWLSDDNVANRTELYAANFGTSSPTRLSDTVLSGVGPFIVSPVTDTVYFSQDANVAGQFDLVRKTFGNLSSIGGVQPIITVSSTGTPFQTPQCTPDGKQFSFLRSATSAPNEKYRLMGYDVDSGLAGEINHSTLDSNLNINADNINRTFMMVAKNEIYYGGNDGGGQQKGVYKTRMVGSLFGGTVVDTLNTTTFGYDSFTAAPGWLFFSNGSTTGTQQYQGYAQNVGASSPPYSLNTYPAIPSVSSFTTSSDQSSPKYPHPLFINGRADLAAGAQAQDLWFKTDYTDPNSDLFKISHVRETAAAGVGKYRLALLAYTRNANGALNVDEANSLFGPWESVTNSFDGGPNSPSVYLPTGTATDMPFAIAIETSLQGTPADADRYILEKGLRGASDATKKTFVVSDSTDLRVFVAD
jgi:hypothetical protein